MQLDALLGNEGVKASLCAALKSGKLSHAVLFSAPDGCGRGFVSRALAADVLFPGGGPGAEAVLAGASPELLMLTGEGKSGNIPVDKVRAVRRALFQTGLSSERRVVWVRDAHRMAAPAANALLKVLEEPPDGVLFILSARDASSLPLTITSRCAVFPLCPLPKEQCEAALREAVNAAQNSADAACPGPAQDPALPALLARVYGGRLGSALKALRDPARMVTLQDALAAAKATERGDGYALLKVFSRYEGKADGDRDRREALLSDLTDALAADLFDAASPSHSASTAIAGRALALLSDARLALAGNAAPKITFSALAVRLKRAIAG